MAAHDSFAIIHASLVNASLGVGLDLHSRQHVADVLASVSFPPPAGCPASADEYLTALEDACHGKRVPHADDPTLLVRSGSAHVFQTELGRACLDGRRGQHVSQVVDWRGFYGALTDGDRLRFGLFTSRPPDAGAPLWHDLAALDPKVRAGRTFVPRDVAGWTCKLIHWWTLRDLVEPILAAVPQAKWADTLRDLLGLYYAEYDPRGTADARARNMRFVLHVPVDVLIGRRHFRPNFSDAGGYRRFVTEFSARPPRTPAHWGVTLDLGTLARVGQLRGGLPERVSPTIYPDDFASEPILFDYLGEITGPRGHEPTDHDFAFKTKLTDAHDAMFPGLTTYLRTLGASLPPMTS